jgi:hypothetical protein
MDPVYYFLLISAGLAVGYAVHAWKNGVVGMLWGITGIVAGLVAGWAVYRFVVSPLALDLSIQLAVAFFGGFVVYLVARGIAKAILCRLFEADSPLQRLADGFPAAVLSLGPSLISILILATGIRVAGTLVELRRYEYLATPGANLTAKSYPKRPAVAEWRDGIESLPGVGGVLDVIDPQSRPPLRNLVGLLILSKKPDLFRHLTEETDARTILTSKAFQRLVTNPDVVEMNTKGERIRMLSHPATRLFFVEFESISAVSALKLHRLVDEFLLSPEHQSIIESLRRSPEDRVDPDAK